MTLFKEKKISHIKAQIGKKMGAHTKLMNYEYGRGKAKKIAEGKKARGMGYDQKKDRYQKLVQEAHRLNQDRD